MSVVLNVYEHEDLAYDYQICEDDDGTFYVWVTTGVLRGRKDAKGLETIQDAMQSLLQVMTQRESWT